MALFGKKKAEVLTGTTIDAVNPHKAMTAASMAACA